MSLVSYLLFDNTPPAFKAKSIHVNRILGDEAKHTRKPPLPLELRMAAKERYIGVIRAMGGKATSIDISEALKLAKNSVNSYLKNNEGIVFERCGKQKTQYCPRTLWRVI